MSRYFDQLLAEEEMQRMQEKIEEMEGAYAALNRHCSALEEIIQDVCDMLAPEDRALVMERRPKVKEIIE